MNVVYAKKWLIGALVLLFVFCFGYLCGDLFHDAFPVSTPLTREMPVFFVKTPKHQACLTFDISWGEKTLPLVLKILADNQVPATFFVSGPWATGHPDAVRAIVGGGHEVASHGDRHVNLSQYSQEEVRTNISKAHDALLTLTGRVAPFFRPPNGDYDDLVIDTARELGYETVIWSVDSLDWKNPGPDYMVNRILDRVFPGAIILCHASDSSKQIDQALPGIIRGLREKGYKLVSLSQLFGAGVPGRSDPR
ncbi:MAG TPA: polysaccharide deacetylase family protein [Bacillota bacterium]